MNYVLYVIAQPGIKLYLKPNMNFSLMKNEAKEFYSKEELDSVRNIFKFDLQEEIGCAKVYIPENMKDKDLVTPGSLSK